MSVHVCAALVKILRRSLTQMSAKKDQFVSQSLKFEREASQQVPSASQHLHPGPTVDQGASYDHSHAGSTS